MTNYEASDLQTFIENNSYTEISGKDFVKEIKRLVENDTVIAFENGSPLNMPRKVVAVSYNDREYHSKTFINVKKHLNKIAEAITATDKEELIERFMKRFNGVSGVFQFGGERFLLPGAKPSNIVSISYEHRDATTYVYPSSPLKDDSDEEYYYSKVPKFVKFNIADTFYLYGIFHDDKLAFLFNVLH